MSHFVWLKSEDIESARKRDTEYLNEVLETLQPKAELQHGLTPESEVWTGCQVIKIIAALAEAEAERRE